MQRMQPKSAATKAQPERSVMRWSRRTQQRVGGMEEQVSEVMPAAFRHQLDIEHM